MEKLTIWDDTFCDICGTKRTALVFTVTGVYDSGDDPVVAAVCGPCMKRAVEEMEEDA